MSDRRVSVTFRMSPQARAEVRRLAELETAGDVSKMLRKLMSEAFQARRDRSELA